MKVRKRVQGPQPGYPSARQMIRLTQALGAAAVGLAAATGCTADAGSKSRAPTEIRLGGDIAVDPRPQPPGGISAPRAPTNAPARATNAVSKGESSACTNAPPAVPGAPPMPRPKGTTR